MSKAARRAQRRRRAVRFGHWGEACAAVWLRLKGYRVLARHVRAPAGEIDMVARRGNVVAFCEVKARRSDGGFATALTPRQMRRIARAAEAFLGRHPELAGCEVRFDVVLVAPFRLPRHLVAAWRTDDLPRGG